MSAAGRAALRTPRRTDEAALLRRALARARASFRRISGVIDLHCVLELRFYSNGVCVFFLEAPFALFTAGASWRPQVAGLVAPGREPPAVDRLP